MVDTATKCPAPSTATKVSARRHRAVFAGSMVATALLLPAGPALAVDGCQVMLCLAAPSWREIPQCVPTIHQLHRDLARGKPFPRCESAGAGNTSSHSWANPPGNCPPQYIYVVEVESGYMYACEFRGVATVVIDGTWFTRSWWQIGGRAVTEFSPTAKARLGSWDPRFDLDLANWLARRAPRPVVDPT